MAKFLVHVSDEIFEPADAKGAAILGVQRILSGRQICVYPLSGKLELVTLSAPDVVTLRQTVEVSK